ncbi:hypothetical protein ES703_47382 [subsurface metagenome]
MELRPVDPHVEVVEPGGCGPAVPGADGQGSDPVLLQGSTDLHELIPGLGRLQAVGVEDRFAVVHGPPVVAGGNEVLLAVHRAEGTEPLRIALIPFFPLPEAADIHNQPLVDEEACPVAGEPGHHIGRGGSGEVGPDGLFEILMGYDAVHDFYVRVLLLSRKFIFFLKKDIQSDKSINRFQKQ